MEVYKDWKYNKIRMEMKMKIKIKLAINFKNTYALDSKKRKFPS